MSSAGKPVLIQPLIAELAVEALEVSVLDKLACLNQFELNTVVIEPSVERVRVNHVLVSAHRLRERAKVRRPFEYSRHMLLCLRAS
jgi:hypothetical protein